MSDRRACSARWKASTLKAESLRVAGPSSPLRSQVRNPALWRSCQGLLNRDDQFRELRRRGRKSARRGRVEDALAIGQKLPVRHIRNCNVNAFGVG